MARLRVGNSPDEAEILAAIQAAGGRAEHARSPPRRMVASSSFPRAVRVVVADGDRVARDELTLVLRGAGCSVVACSDAPSLARVIDEHVHPDPRAVSVLAIEAGLPHAEGIPGLRRLGVFDLGVPVVVTSRAGVSPELEDEAYAAGAMLLVDAGVEATARAVRHVVERERRWTGEWVGKSVSTTLAQRPARASESK